MTTQTGNALRVSAFVSVTTSLAVGYLAAWWVTTQVLKFPEPSAASNVTSSLSPFTQIWLSTAAIAVLFAFINAASASILLQWSRSRRDSTRAV